MASLYTSWIPIFVKNNLQKIKKYFQVHRKTVFYAVFMRIKFTQLLNSVLRLTNSQKSGDFIDFGKQAFDNKLEV